MALKADFGTFESWVAQHARIFALLVVSLVAFAGVAAVVVFFIALRGAEQSLVPDVRNRELASALIELQAKELYPRIQLRWSETVQDRGLVLEQDPRPGTIVKAGRRIRLVVSQGPLLTRIEDYRSRNYEEALADLQALYSSSASPVSVKEPPLYLYSAEPAGTILEQNPEPGTPVSGPVALEFVVSRGPEHVLIAVPSLTGLSPKAALERLREAGLRFRFSLRQARAGERAGLVVYQEPAADSALESALPVNIQVSDPGPLAGGNEIFLYEYTMPENPVPLQVRLEYLPPGGVDRVLIAETDFQGGLFSFPCQAPAGSTLIFSMMGREINRHLIQPRADALSLDEL